MLCYVYRALINSRVLILFRSYFKMLVVNSGSGFCYCSVLEGKSTHIHFHKRFRFVFMITSCPVVFVYIEFLTRTNVNAVDLNRRKENRDQHNFKFLAIALFPGIKVPLCCLL